MVLFVDQLLSSPPWRKGLFGLTVWGDAVDPGWEDMAARTKGVSFSQEVEAGGCAGVHIHRSPVQGGYSHLN